MIEFHHVWKEPKPTKCHVSEIVWFLDLWLPIEIDYKRMIRCIFHSPLFKQTGRHDQMNFNIPTFPVPWIHLVLGKSHPKKAWGDLPSWASHRMTLLPGLDGSLLLWAVRTSVFTAARLLKR